MDVMIMARFTDRQLDDAKRTDLAAFLRYRGEKLVRSGSEYRWVYRDGAGEHDSVTVKGNRWFDHKQQIGGDAIGFLQEFMGYSFREAVAQLIMDNGELKMKERPQLSTINSKLSIDFALPERNHNMHRLYAYLCKTRHIDHEVVTHFVRAGVLYEDTAYHNAVFLATDENNKPLGGMKKSTLSGGGFRQTITGSDTRYAFHHRGSSGRLYVFEAAVDMLSFITLHPEGWRQHSYLALDGVSSKALHHFLAAHEDVQDICLCLDNDAAGNQAALRIASELREQPVAVSMLLPEGKDWNDMLVTQAQAQIHDPPEPEITMTQ
ncbi:toprim domain-containing protein [Oscillospiraceae bacterium OttesenSCG-928-G22]|nr:toprim domain-containing protein [Oscillospiraceae bacterium OttesenSCG-928-G22]